MMTSRCGYGRCWAIAARMPISELLHLGAGVVELDRRVEPVDIFVNAG